MMEKLLAIVLLGTLIAGTLLSQGPAPGPGSSPGSGFSESQGGPPTRESRAPESHSPISILSDSGFTVQNGVRSGTGSTTDPYIVENWNIDAAGTAYCIWIENTTAFFEVRNNTLSGVAFGSWTTHPPSGIRLFNLAGARVSGNTFSGDSYSPVYMSNCDGTIVTGNHVTGSEDGIYASNSRNITISGNDVEDVNEGGIQLFRSTGCLVDKNTLSGGSIIYLNEANTFNTISNNSIDGDEAMWITKDSCNNTVKRNTIINAETRGIVIQSRSHRNRLENNTIRTGGYAVYIDMICSNNSVLNNSFWKSKGTGPLGYDDGTDNAWDDGAKGNRWSDWQPPAQPDSNSDGILDTPYPIAGSAGSNDRYPLSWATEAEAVKVSAFVAAGIVGLAVLLGLGIGLVLLVFHEPMKFRFYCLAPFAILATRRSKDNFVRGKIMGFIIASPGCHYNLILKCLDMNNGSLAYHMDRMIKDGEVVTVNDGIYKRFYPPAHGLKDEGVLTDIQARLLDVIRLSPGITTKDLASQLKMSRQLVNYHVKAMGTKSLVFLDTGVFRTTKVFPADSIE